MTMQKTTKIALFASLIAMLAVPISSIDSANAEKTSQETLNKYAEKYTKLQKKIDGSDDPEKIKKWEEKQDEILDKVKKLIKNETGNDIDEIQIITSGGNDQVTAYSSPSKYSKSGNQTGCDKNTEGWTFYGYIYHGNNYFWQTYSFPEVSEGSFPNCTEKLWADNLYMKVENLFSFGNETCEANFIVSSYGSNKIICEEIIFDWGELWSIHNRGDYTNGKSISGTAIVWLV